MKTVARHYEVAGAVIESEVELADLRGVEAPNSEPPAVRVRRGFVAEHLESARLVGPAYEADESSFLLITPQLRCRVDEGIEITVEALNDADTATVETLLLGAPLAALCYQRGLMPLSATAIEVNGGAVAIVGESGSGKSTIGALLAQRGYALLGDDLLPVLAAEQPLAYGARQRLRLWRDVLDVMHLDHRDLAADRPGLQRYRLDPPQTVPGPLPLRRLYVLGARPDIPRHDFEPLRRLDAVGAAAGMLMLPALWPLTSEPQDRFRRLVTLVGNAAIIKWTRTLAFDQLEAQLDALEADMTRATA